MNNVTGRAQWLIDKLISITNQLQWHRNRFGDKLTKICYVVVVFYYLATPDQLGIIISFRAISHGEEARAKPNPSALMMIHIRTATMVHCYVPGASCGSLIRHYFFSSCYDECVYFGNNTGTIPEPQSNSINWQTHALIDDPIDPICTCPRGGGSIDRCTP